MEVGYFPLQAPFVRGPEKGGRGEAVPVFITGFQKNRPVCFFRSVVPGENINVALVALNQVQVNQEKKRQSQQHTHPCAESCEQRSEQKSEQGKEFNKAPLSVTTPVRPHPPGRDHPYNQDNHPQQGKKFKPVFPVQGDKSKERDKRDGRINKQALAVREQYVHHLRVQEIKSFLSVRIH